MVLLKCDTQLSFITGVDPSTFHYGSIKIIFKMEFDKQKKLSTFHYGSIKIKLIKMKKLTLVYLHSTMVLLK